MFKILTLAILFYFAYRVFLRPMLPPKEERRFSEARHTEHKSPPEEEEGEYIDYEEIDD